MKDYRDGSDLVAAWEEQNNVHRYEGDSGVRDLGRLVEALDPDNYRDLDRFLADNPGCCDAMVEWITEWLDKSDTWRHNIIDLVGPEVSDELKDQVRQNARAVIEGAQRVTGELPDAEDTANVLAMENEDLMNSEGEILRWVIDECQRALDEVKKQNEDPKELTLNDLVQASKAQAEPVRRQNVNDPEKPFAFCKSCEGDFSPDELLGTVRGEPGYCEACRDRDA